MRSSLLPNCTRLRIALLLVCVAGCAGRETPPSQPSEGGIEFWSSSDRSKFVPGFDGGSIIFGSYKGGIVLIWSDTDSVHGGFLAGFPLAKADDTFEYRRSNRRIKCSCEFNVNSGSGHCTINDKTHDLQNGSLFLVSGASAEIRVKQLSRNLNAVRDALAPTFDREKLIVFGKSDPEITAFFSNTEKDK
jgi:hypothetical protein